MELRADRGHLQETSQADEKIIYATHDKVRWADVVWGESQGSEPLPAPLLWGTVAQARRPAVQEGQLYAAERGTALYHPPSGIHDIRPGRWSPGGRPVLRRKTRTDDIQSPTPSVRQSVTRTPRAYDPHDDCHRRPMGLSDASSLVAHSPNGRWTARKGTSPVLTTFTSRQVRWRPRGTTASREHTEHNRAPNCGARHCASRWRDCPGQGATQVPRLSLA